MGKKEKAFVIFNYKKQTARRNDVRRGRCTFIIQAADDQVNIISFVSFSITALTCLGIEDKGQN